MGLLWGRRPPLTVPASPLAADRKAAQCPHGAAPRRQDHQPGHRRHHGAHPLLCRGRHGQGRGGSGHAGGLLGVRPRCFSNLSAVLGLRPGMRPGLGLVSRAWLEEKGSTNFRHPHPLTAMSWSGISLSKPGAQDRVYRYRQARQRSNSCQQETWPASELVAGARRVPGQSLVRLLVCAWHSIGGAAADRMYQIWWRLGPHAKP